MPRSRKEDRKKKEDSDEEFDIIEEEDEEENEEETKSSKKKSSKKKSEDIEKEEDSREKNDTRRSWESYPKTDPKAAIGTLKTDEILKFLIDRGSESLNPRLKFGAISLLQDLTGQRRRGHGSKRGGYRGNHFGSSFPRRRYDGYSNGSKSQLFASANDNLYEDN